MLDVCDSVARQRVDAVPIGDQQAVKPQLSSEHVREQPFVAVHALAVPAVVRNHDRADPCRDGRTVAIQVGLSQRTLIADGISAVHAERRSAVSHEVFGGGQHATRLRHLRSLESRIAAGPSRVASSDVSPKPS